MKKFFTVCLWLGLAASLVMLACVAGERNALRKENRSEKSRTEVLQTLYDQDKAEWETGFSGLRQENEALRQRVALLTLALRQRPEAERDDAQPDTAEALAEPAEDAAHTPRRPAIDPGLVSDQGPVHALTD